MFLCPFKMLFFKLQPISMPSFALVLRDSKKRKRRGNFLAAQPRLPFNPAVRGGAPADETPLEEKSGLTYHIPQEFLYKPGGRVG